MNLNHHNAESGHRQVTVNSGQVGPMYFDVGSWCDQKEKEKPGHRTQGRVDSIMVCEVRMFVGPVDGGMRGSG